MGYFSNGTQGQDYKYTYCDKCKNWAIREGETVEGCPIWDMHLKDNYKLCNQADSYLDKLIPRTELSNAKCIMFLAN